MNLADNLMRRFWRSDNIPDSEGVGKLLWLWDGAHMVELLFEHSLRDVKRLSDAKAVISSLNLFFRLVLGSALKEFYSWKLCVEDELFTRQYKTVDIA